MAGHSKWANIKHRKGAQDAKKSKIFQKVSKEIIVAIKENGNDPDKNSRLRLAIDKAKSVNMPSDNIKRLLEKSNKDESNFQELIYEGYGPSGVAVIVECLTDNVNRTSPLIKATFSKNGGNLGTNGSVSYMFESKGEIVLSKEKYNVNNLMNLIIEKDILDFKEEEDFIIIETSPSNFIEIKNFLVENKVDDFVSSKVSKISNSTISLNENEFLKVEKLIDALENLDDVQNVYTNIE